LSAGPAFREDRDSNIIRLGPLTKQGLKARLNENIEAEKIALRPVEKLTLISALDVSTAHHLPQHIRQTLVEQQTPVAVDSVFYINFPHSTAGATYTVHTLDPGPGIITAETEIRLEDREAHSVEEVSM